MPRHNYFAHYQHYSHQDLYNRVVQAQPHTATASAAYWFRVQNELYDLSQAIANDVATVAPTWHGDGSDEFQHRMSIVSAQDLAAGQARVAEAESAVRLAQVRLAQGQIHAPVSGVVYSLPARPGTYLNPGDLVASIGNIDHLRVRVYVDEPELGRIQVGQPVKITWDGLPGHAWEGTVEKKPAAIVPLGTRQVGEVLVTIANPNHDLVPGTNINAEIRTKVVNNALTIPKETMHRENGVVGVYLLQDGRVVWRPVKVGAASVTRAQIIEGLADNDAVALPSDRALKNGDAVRPIIQ